MVRVLILLLFPFLAFSGEFQARVNRNPVPKGEGVVLSLILNNANASEGPALEPLKSSFVIRSQQQAQNTSIINGTRSDSITWQITLVPQKQGNIEIPAIAINTSEGVLKTSPIQLQVKETVGDENTIVLTSETSSLQPYKNETLLYTIKLTSKHDLANLSFDKVTLDGAMIEATGKPKVEKLVVNGMKTNVIELNYLITPLMTGTVVIPPFSIQGDILARRGNDLFSMMQSFDQLKPFIRETEPMLLQVQPPNEGINPWIPAESITIQEVFNPTVLKVHEPITRNFEIYGVGLLSSLLPDLSDSQGTSFKVYADNPERGDEVKEGKLHSYRKEQYTLIPQSAGDLTLPEISIAWWDVKNDKKVISKVPARTVSILPLDQKNEPTVAVPTVIIEAQNSVLYYVIGGLTVALILALTWIMALQRKMNPAQAPKPPKKSKKETLPDLNPT